MAITETPADLPDDLRFLAGGGEATRLILARDWSVHPLGPPAQWSEGLKTALSLILNSPESMILCWGESDLRFFFNETYFPLLGPRLDWAMGAPFAEVWADALDQARPIIDQAFAGDSRHFTDLPWTLDTDRGQADTWWSFSYSRVLDPSGEVAGLFIFTNETTERVLADAARKEAEDRRALMAQESAHRLKNTLAMVQALAVQSLKGVDRDTVRAFQDRLLALATAHEALTQQQWEKADLGELISGALRNVSEVERFDLTGPPVWISDRAAQSTTLLIHEMTTNALKHGALSVPGGRVRVSWAVRGDDFVLDWIEQGGPPASQPARRGFGSRLISMGLVGKGGADLTYGDDGLRAVFSAPFDRLAPE